MLYKETWVVVTALALLLSSCKKLLATDEGSNCLVPKPVLHLKLDKQFSLELYHGADNRARPRPRPRTQKTHVVQQTCNFAFMQAQLSELQNMSFQLSESVNVNKNRVEPYIGVSFSDSKLTHYCKKARVMYKRHYRLHQFYWKHANSRQCGPSHTSR